MYQIDRFDSTLYRLIESWFMKFSYFQPLGDPICINKEEINKRIAELDSLVQSTKYSKQKQGLKNELISFLSGLSDQKNLDNATPSDIRMFLAHKDLQGKTQIHDSKCIHRGTRGTFQCGCPLRRSAASMDSLIGQIRAIFRDEASRGKTGMTYWVLGILQQHLLLRGIYLQ